MNYIEKCETCNKYYTVEIDEEKLKEIMEKLKDYSYITTSSVKLAGNITKWPATVKNIKNRVINFFNNETNKKMDATIIPETIVHHVGDNCDYVTYDYTYRKLPTLYDYIDIIVNNKDVFESQELVDGDTDVMFATYYQDQFVLEGILNYHSSNELTHHNSIEKNEDYDYRGLNELYNETLNCFKYNLVAVKVKDLNKTLTKKCSQ